jgi:ribosomal protein L40E
MILSRLKVCPVCGEHNTPALLECTKCETDLTGVKVIDETMLRAESQSAEHVGPGSDVGRMTKKCDCGATNPPQARKCTECGEDISDLMATDQTGSADMESKAVTLRSVDGGFSFQLEKPVTIIGREGDLGEYLGAKTYVSRQHAKLTLAHGEIYIENISGTNPTFVNNASIPEGTPTLLKHGDEVGLGGKLVNGHRQEHAAHFLVLVAG